MSSGYVRTGGPPRLKAYLEGLPGVVRVEIAGSYRRGRETVGDLDVLVCTADGRLSVAAVLLKKTMLATCNNVVATE